MPTSQGRLTPVERPRALKEQIVAALEQGIFTGEFPPGGRLVERELATRFNVSSIPVREALQELEMRGLVVKRLNHGCTVVELSPEAAVRASAVRTLLEPATLAWAARNLRPEQVAPLKERMRALVAAARKNDVPLFFRMDILLHKTLWEIGGNEFATRALEGALGSLFASTFIRAREEKTLDMARDVRSHGALVDAVLARDASRAEGLGREIAQALDEVSAVAATQARRSLKKDAAAKSAPPKRLRKR